MVFRTNRSIAGHPGVFREDTGNFERLKRLVIFMIPARKVKVMLSAISGLDDTENLEIYKTYIQ
jgi:hypothetical protein